MIPSTWFFARQVLHHARDLKQLARELSRVLKPWRNIDRCARHVISKPADLKSSLRFILSIDCMAAKMPFLLNDYQQAIRELFIYYEHS